MVNTDSITLPRYSVGVVNVYLSNSTGLDNQNKINAKIYPNPANDILFIDLDEPSNNLDIRIIDVLGKLVYAEPFGDFRKTSIPTNSLNGVYFLSIVDENGNIKHAQKIEIF
ncbi:MAG: T9SS type A sorting domain-containing protein [Bacteroidetes bacterium]|nr:T9SS type A sorting domain-containing protein [Bacteroidota bacterium]